MLEHTLIMRIPKTYYGHAIFTRCTHPDEQVSTIGVTPQDVCVISVTLTEAFTTTLKSWMTGRHI